MRIPSAAPLVPWCNLETYCPVEAKLRVQVSSGPPLQKPKQIVEAGVAQPEERTVVIRGHARVQVPSLAPDGGVAQP